MTGQARLTPMRRSAYIEFYEDDRTLYAISLMSLGILAFPRGARRRVESLLDNPGRLKGSEDGRGLRGLLASNGFLVQDDEDEVATLRRRHELSRGTPKAFSAQIAVTLDCNFRCSYCYETRDSITLTRETEDAIVGRLHRGIPQWKTLSVIWFGGEPLLELDIIRRMSAGILQECDRHGTAYTGHLVTNGYLLDGRVARQLADCSVRVVQITLDGDASTHDVRRVLPGNRPTYERILENIRETHDRFDVIIVRVNIEDQPIEAIMHVIEDLAAAKDHISLRFSQTNVVSHCIHPRGDHADFLRKASALGERALAEGFRLSTGAKLPGGCFCPAYASNCLLVDARGDVHRCVADTGRRDRRVGYLTPDGHVQELETAPRYDFDPFRDEDCLSCRVLPLCMGGCPKFPIDDKSATGRCVVKENLRATLEQMVRDADGVASPMTVGRAAEGGAACTAQRGMMEGMRATRDQVR